MFDLIGEVLAVVYVVVFALLLIDAQWPFLSNVDWLYAVFKGIWMYGAFVIAAVVGLEAMVKRNFLLFLIFAALLAVCIIFIFFRDVREPAEFPPLQVRPEDHPIKTARRSAGRFRVIDRFWERSSGARSARKKWERALRG